MADNKEVKFKLDLDIQEFTEKMLSAKGSVQGLSDAENLTGLMEGLSKVTIGLGAVGVAAFALKKAFDLTLEAEQIQKINNQFETFSKQAGISADKLRSGLEHASKGLIDTDEVLQIANKSILALGSSASRLPEVMEMARKATSVFGGDLKTNFENITFAIDTGNARLLKQYGIVIDTTKAYDDYAKANGVAANELSKAGQQQAIMNAVLEVGQKRFKDVNEDMQSATMLVGQIKTELKEMADDFAITINNVLGPAIRFALTQFKEFLQFARHTNVSFTLVGAAINSVTQALGLSHAKLKDVRTEVEGIKSAAGGGGEGGELRADLINQEARLENQRKFESEMNKIKADSLKESMLNVQSFADIERILDLQVEQDKREHETKLKEISNAKFLNDSTRRQLADAEEERYAIAEKSRQQSLADTRRKLLDNYQKNAKGTFDGISRAYAVNMAKQNSETADFGKRGAQVLNSFQGNAVTAFTAMGAAATQGANLAETAAKAAGAAILGTIGDKAIADGSYMLMAGLWPPNPVALGAGAGLIALGGSLKAVSGGLISSMSPGGGGAGGVGGQAAIADPCPLIAKAKSCPGNDSGSMLEEGTPTEAIRMPDGQIQPDLTMLSKQQKSVSVHISGNYYDTESSRRQLMEMIRQETDATDFKYDTIGVGA